jgi:CHAT domain-containing protein
MRVLPGTSDLRRDVEEFQRLILSSRDPLGEAAPAGRRLWRDLVAPVVHAVPPGSRVIIVPDGPLHRLNFETLVAPEPRPHYWIEDVAVAYAPSLSLLEPRAPGRGLGSDGLLVIGDPSPASDEFPRLAHAALEVERVAGAFERERRHVITGAEADPVSYRRAHPERFSFIHFAAHATANRVVPLESAIVLSRGREAYKLYARDVMDVPLSANLVTLSACRSAGSRAFAGEGLVGLAWVFLGSGAAHVIGGLWNVEDASTAEVMEHLYRGLRRGEDPVAALRDAKLRLLHSGTAYRKPFYCAPFVTYVRSPAMPAR